MAAKTGRKPGAAGSAKRNSPEAEVVRPERRAVIVAWILRAVLLLVALGAVAIGAYRVIDPPTTLYMAQERARLGNIVHDWTPADEIAPVMFRAAVAAEDANFCRHWGFDMGAIRRAIEDGGNRGASTITQQTVKNVYLWHGRTWLRKSLEAAITPGVEAVWPKRRILEVYLNVAEFGEGLFGVGEAAQYYFGVDASELSSRQAALLAAILPDPKARDAGRPSAFVQRRAESIRDGAATIDRDGRADCFQ